MAVINNYTDKRILILDDLPDMRTSLRTQMAALGCEKVVMTSAVKDALEHFSRQSFDIVLCDYYLAGGTDGQQFLEYLRTRNVISNKTIFIMVTAEKDYGNVVTAAEWMPDEYLLKPFTAEALKTRLERLIDKKRRFNRVDELLDKGQWSDVAVACDEIIAAKDRYYVDALRTKGMALIQAKRAKEAQQFYEDVIAMRPMPWASLGLAKALHLCKENERAREVLEGLLIEAPQLVAAYDLLGQLHMYSGRADAALRILDKACAVSPKSLKRHRQIAHVAAEKGDFARVQQALDHVVSKTKFSPLRETADFARLGKALTELGQADKAVALLVEARTNFKEDANDPHLAAVEALAYQKAGDPEKAAAALERAMQQDHLGMPEDVALVVANACMATGKQEAAERIFKNLVQSNPDAQHLHDKVSSVLREHGAEDRAEALVSESIREIIELNNAAVLKAKAGELTEAAAMLQDAANRLPGNIQIVSNAAHALLFDIVSNGFDLDKFEAAKQFQHIASAQNPTYPKLADIASLMKQVHTKFLPTRKS